MPDFPLPILFCPECRRYLGATESCISCGWVRPRPDCIPEPGKMLWCRPTQAAPAGEPLFAGEVIYFADQAGGLYAVRAASGEPIGCHAGAEDLNSSPLAVGTRVYTASRTGLLRALDFTPGSAPSEAWAFPLDARAGRLAGDGGLLYIGTSAGLLYALKDTGNTCEIAWKVALDQPLSAAPRVWRHLLLAATSHPNGQVIAIETRGRQEAWRRPLGGRGRYLALARPNPKDPDRLAVIVATDQGRLSAYTLPDGDPLGWSYLVEGGLSTPPVVGEGVIYLGGGNGHVTALNLSDGSAHLLADFGGCITGLASWRGLLFAAVLPGKVYALDGTSGEQAWQWDVPGGLAPRAHLAARDGMVLVGSASAGWLALPWHLGEYRWAAECCQKWGDLDSTAAYSALAEDGPAAEAAWVDAGKPETAARMWSAIGKDERAGDAYCMAAKKIPLKYPPQAAMYYHRAADHFEISGNESKEKECRKEAGRMGFFPYLRLEVINHSLVEAGLPGTLSVAVRNFGNSPAHQVKFRLGGRLANLVRGELKQPLSTGSQAELEFENLIPILAGDQQLRILLTYTDGSGSILQAETALQMTISPPPPGSIQVSGDGVVTVRIPAGAPRPAVRVRGNAVINYKVTEKEE